MFYKQRVRVPGISDSLSDETRDETVPEYTMRQVSLSSNGCSLAGLITKTDPHYMAQKTYQASLQGYQLTF